MTTVWIVFEDDCNQSKLVGVYTSKDLAEEAARKTGSMVSTSHIEEWATDTAPERIWG